MTTTRKTCPECPRFGANYPIELDLLADGGAECPNCDRWWSSAEELVSKRVTVRFDGDEYRVPTGPTDEEPTAYYTDDRDDAVATAQVAHGENVVVSIRRVDLLVDDDA